MDLKEVKGTNGVFLVSEDGHLFRRYGNKLKVSTISSSSNGYKIVNIIYANGERKAVYFQKLMMETFGELRDQNVWAITHIDKDKTNNAFSNLKWIKRSEMRTGGPKHMIEVFNAETGENIVYESITEAAKAYHTSTQVIKKLYLKEMELKNREHLTFKRIN